jgi:glutamine amidotransferase-like uncharacterized protein
MDVSEHYITINSRLVQGERVFFSQIGKDGTTPSLPKDRDRVLRYPKIGIYTGKGASHSWLWFVDLFDRFGFYDIELVSENDIRAGSLRYVNVLAMSGGDTFAVAEGLGERGAEKLESFIRGGGLYVGSCAGAYLPLYSSKRHLNLFNFVDAKIANIAPSVPKARTSNEKFCTPYGCAFIFHPVRESVRLATNGFIPFKGVESLLAPLYGGPPMVASNPSQIVATYSDFTEKTLFLVDKEVARETLLGKAAVIRKQMGAGHLYLFGPHFEHPHFPVANRLLLNAIYWDAQEPPLSEEGAHKEQALLGCEDMKVLLRDIKREISNSRIVAAGLETLPVRWKIGNKIYEPEKIRVFIDAIWQRIKVLERSNRLEILRGEGESILQGASEVTLLLRDVKRGIDAGIDTIGWAKRVFELLNRNCTTFLEMYFRTKMGQWQFS